ncbi:hypothetical protein OPT61_g5012 [Boeremia exigua]|uniref:Uncharacterized protein n=1 Tax=Boeremia exigua TaxID=749465 RepID=A0ACC2IBT4_9PLEO|nr:hypothetical protein OPT61_g5012 [Boeremia exigua]
MAGRRFATFGGLAAVGAGTYYLYSAGGDPKLAEKKFEHDAATAARKVRGDFPGQDKEATSWAMWTGKNAEKGVHELSQDIGQEWEDDLEVHHHLNVKPKKNFGKTPRIRGATDSCRIFGSLDGNKVQGDFHITARGHGYMEFGEHLDHHSFNFSHVIREMSFGPYFPSMNNPLDNTIALTPTPTDNFYKFQYYLSIVPTIYTDSLRALKALDTADSASGLFSQHAIRTNQYAVTSQSHTVPEQSVPGVFVKFDIEPITLSIIEEWGGFWPLVVRLVNIISGVMVAGGWAWQMYDLALEFWGRRGRRGDGMGMLGTPQIEKKSWD